MRSVWLRLGLFGNSEVVWLSLFMLSTSTSIGGNSAKVVLVSLVACSRLLVIWYRLRNFVLEVGRVS